jgi:outer membrane protein assembly factor BamB
MKSYLIKSLILSVLITVAINASYGQVSGWHGPERSGIYNNETGLLKEWPAAGPTLLWDVTGFGKGYSSATVTSDAVYITGIHGDKDVLTAYTLDGKKKWEVEYGNMAQGVNSPESRCTATYSNGKLFVISGSGDLVCVSKEGKIIWQVNHYQKYDAPVQRFGISESPVVVDNKVIASPGGNKASLVAFNVDNGSVVWEAAPLNEGTQYVNPLLVEINKMKVIITHTVTFIIGVNAADGKILWKFDFGSVNKDKKGGKNYINTPIYKDGFVFAANGYGQVAAKIRINNNGSDPDTVWTNKEITPHVGGMVLMGNYIYSSRHEGNTYGRWICVDWTTGKTMWMTDWKNKGSMISAEGLLYIYEEKTGNLALVRPSGEKLDIISSFQLPKGSFPFWAHPVIDKGKLYVRGGDYMAVYSLKAK